MSSSWHAIIYQVCMPSISTRIKYCESLERRILVCFTSHLPQSRRRGKLSASKAGLDHHIESPRAGRSGVKLSRTDPQRSKVYCRGWVGRILGSAVSHEPSCPSRLHLLHNGASTRTISQVPARTSGKSLLFLRAAFLGEDIRPRNGVLACKLLCSSRDPWVRTGSPCSLGLLALDNCCDRRNYGMTSMF